MEDNRLLSIHVFVFTSLFIGPSTVEQREVSNGHPQYTFMGHPTAVPYKFPPTFPICSTALTIPPRPSPAIIPAAIAYPNKNHMFGQRRLHTNAIKLPNIIATGYVFDGPRTNAMPTAFQFGTQCCLSAGTQRYFAAVLRSTITMNARAVIPEDVGIGRELEETAIETARQLLTSGTANSQVDEESVLMHGYALLKTTYIAVLRKMETSAPKHCE